MEELGDRVLQFILATHSNSTTCRSCSLVFHATSSLSSSGHNLFNRAMAESSLFLTTGDICSGVSQSHNVFRISQNLMKFQQCIKRCLGKGLIIDAKDRGIPGSPYNEISDLVVDRLLLRYLSSSVSRCTRCDSPIPAHLIVTDSLSKSIDEFRHLFGVLSLVQQPSCGALSQQCSRSIFDML